MDLRLKAHRTLSENREFLKTLCAEIGAHRQQQNTLADYVSQFARQLAEESKRAADELERNLRPPIDEPSRFYGARPNLEIGNLPRAY